MSDSDGDNQRRIKTSLMRRFDFSSALQRMSVVCKDDFDGLYRAFVKGSPEKIQELCEQVPGDFKQVLELFTNEGYRVIALAYKNLP
jgi:P-type E1-E2 ATPase